MRWVRERGHFRLCITLQAWAVFKHLLNIFYLLVVLMKVTLETEEMRFNTGISAMMEFVNAATKWGGAPKSVLEPFTLLLSPYAPHVAEEFWATLGHTQSLAQEPWPEVRRPAYPTQNPNT